MKRIKRINAGCGFFPCHKGLEDCTFCYCPFYPCLNEKLGEYVYSKKRGEKIWSCQHCVWLHKKSAVDKVFKIIRENRDKIFPSTRYLILKAKNKFTYPPHPNPLPQEERGL